MKLFIVLTLIVLSSLSYVAAASAADRYCRAGDRACQRRMLIANCFPLNNTLTHWVCPDPYNQPNNVEGRTR